MLLLVRRIASSASASVSGVIPYLCKINGSDVKEGHALGDELLTSSSRQGATTAGRLEIVTENELKFIRRGRS
jgi:hypothetical protein